MIYALVKNDVIQNVIVADAAFVAMIAQDWDDVIQVDDSPGSPGVGWVRSGDGDSFEPPAAPA